jgi:hypothetical protein
MVVDEDFDRELSCVILAGIQANCRCFCSARQIGQRCVELFDSCRTLLPMFQYVGCYL